MLLEPQQRRVDRTFVQLQIVLLCDGVRRFLLLPHIEYERICMGNQGE